MKGQTLNQSLITR